MIEFVKLRVGHIRFRQQDVHVTGHASRNRVNRIFHRHSAFLERIGQFAQRMLRLSSRHTVAGDEDSLPRIGQLNGDILERLLRAYSPLTGCRRRCPRRSRRLRKGHS